MRLQTINSQKDTDFWCLVVILAAMGSVYGIIHAVYQSPMDNGRSLAGITPLVPGSPWSYYLFKAWSLLNQIAALFLKMGFTDSNLSIAFSVVQSSLSFVSAGILAYAMRRKAGLSILAAVLLFEFALKGQGPCYPISLITYNAHGTFGLTAALLALGFIGSGRPGPGLFLLGVLPSAHLPWAGFLGLVLIVTAAFDLRRWVCVLKNEIWWLLAGVGVSASSFGVQEWLTGFISLPVDSAFVAAFTSRYYAVFWDHRTAMHWFPQDILQIAITAVVSMGMILPSARKEQPYRAFCCLALIISVLLAAGLWGLSFLSDHESILFRLMPGRFVNLAIFPASVLFLGSSRACSKWGVPWDALVLTALLVVDSRLGLGLNEFNLVLWLLLFAALWRLLRPLTAEPSSFCAWQPKLNVLAVASVIMAVVFGIVGYPHADVRLRTWDNGGFEALVSARPGGLLMSWDVPMVTRRPIPFSQAIDYMPYLPETAHAVDEHLRDIYGLDIMDPGLPHGIRTTYQVEKYWCSLTRERWVEIGSRYSFTDVLVPASITLDLPLAAQTCGFKLYEVAQRSEQ